MHTRLSYYYDNYKCIFNVIAELWSAMQKKMIIQLPTLKIMIIIQCTPSLTRIKIMVGEAGGFFWLEF